MAFLIRDLRMDDAEALQRMSSGFGDEDGPETWRARIRQLISSTDHHALVAEWDGHPVGWIHFFITYRLQTDPFMEVGGLFVDESYRKQGIGQRLMEAFAKVGARHRIARIRARCNIARDPAIRFYEQLDFEPVKEQRVFDKDLPNEDGVSG